MMGYGFLEHIYECCGAVIIIIMDEIQKSLFKEDWRKMNAKVNFAAKTLNMCVCLYEYVFVYVYTNICVCIVHLGINLELFKIARER